MSGAKNILVTVTFLHRLKKMRAEIQFYYYYSLLLKTETIKTKSFHRECEWEIIKKKIWNKKQNQKNVIKSSHWLLKKKCVCLAFIQLELYKIESNIDFPFDLLWSHRLNVIFAWFLPFFFPISFTECIGCFLLIFFLLLFFFWIHRHFIRFGRFLVAQTKYHVDNMSLRAQTKDHRQEHAHFSHRQINFRFQIANDAKSKYHLFLLLNLA